MTTSFKICWCGYPENNHSHFRHTCVPTITVKKIEDTSMFLIDALEYPEKKGERCSFPNCKVDKYLHDTLYTKEFLEELRQTQNYEKDIIHLYDPQIYTYREINLVIPSDYKCKSCGKNMEFHREIHKGNSSLALKNAQGIKEMQHAFKVNLMILNKGDMDVVNLLDGQDDDLHIVC